MAPQTQRWFIRQEGPKTASLQTAFSWLQERMTASASHQGLLAVSNKQILENIKGVLGEDVVKQLKKNNTIRLKSGNLDLMTKNIHPHSGAGSVLVIYPPSQFLDRVDALQFASEILVLPWNLPEVEPWVQMWNVRELGDSSPRPTKTFSNPTVRAALETLTSQINLSTGLSHSSDKAAASEMFQLLKSSGEAFNPEEVKSWLVSQLRWQPEQANDAAEIAQNVLSGKTMRSGSSTRWASDIVSYWKEEGTKF